MRIRIQNRSSRSIPTDLSVRFISQEQFAAGSRNAAAAELHKLLGSDYRSLLSGLAFSGRHGEQALVPGAGTPKRTVLVTGFETSSEDSTRARLERIRDLASRVIKQANHLGSQRIDIVLDPIWIGGEEPLEAFWEGLELSDYQFTRYKTGKKKKRPGTREITLLASRVPDRSFSKRMEAICKSVLFARDLINTPPNDLRPTALARICRSSARASGLNIELYDKRKLERIGAGGILCVGMGSEDPSWLAKITYRPRGKKARKHIALVGKAVTFDTGGLVIKSSMETMKCDMSGGAAVLATMTALKTLQLPVEVSAYIPITENMINGNAMRPGDVFTLLCGKTVEVLNTDAEGRLILADALTLASRAKPDAIIDLATLTGACAAALGTKFGGMFCNDDQLADTLTEASDLSGEPLWRLPLAREYHKLIFSDVADYKNLFKDARAITAALFLEEFVDQIPWAHLDIAGPAFTGSNEGVIKAGGVGFGVRTLLRMLEIIADSK